MRGRALALCWLAAVLIAAGCGDDGDSGASGAAAGGPGGGATTGSGGAGGATTGTGGSTGAGGGSGSPCAWGDDCGAGLFCDAPGCGAGACAPRPPPASLPPDESPVCGCDGNTYWNEAVAAWKGVAAQAAGACPAAAPCGPASPCPAALKCRREVAGAAACSAQATGTCWGMPISCDLGGPQGRGCVGGSCEVICSLIQSQNPWYADASCP